MKATEIAEQPGPFIEAAAGENYTTDCKSERGRPLLPMVQGYKGTDVCMYASTSVLELPNANQLDNGQYCCAVANDYIWQYSQ